MAVYLVRHAVATGRSGWNKSDELRPLTKKGQRQAAALFEHLGAKDVRRVHSSPAVRCVDTMAPLAKKAGLPVKALADLNEGGDVDKAIELVRRLASRDGDSVVCAHGDLIPEILRLLARDGVELLDEPSWAKGSTWVLEPDGGKLRRARYLPPPPT